MIKTITTGALLAAAALLVTPTANADPDGSAWAAIAYSTTTGKETIVTNAASQLDGMNHAMASCNKAAGDNSCKVVTFSKFCVSLATDPNPNNNTVYSGGKGNTLAAADADAMSGAQAGWTIEEHGCNS